MKEITYNGIAGVFLTTRELEDIQNKILANNDLINALIKEVGIDEQTI